jgi:glycosyltransferase involved in cell wall biosynthesis
LPIRIAIITTGFSKNENDYSGAAAFHNFVKELSSHNEIDVTVFSFYYPVNQPEYNFYNAKVFSFASGSTDSSLSKVITWRKCEKKFTLEHKIKKFDLIHSMWSRESGFTASRLCRKLKIPFIAGIGGGELANFRTMDYGSRTTQLQKYFVDRTFAKADVIATGSDYISVKINKYYGDIISSKVRKLPYGVDENVFFVSNPAFSEINNSKVPSLINIANAVPVKSHKTLFKALKIVSEKFPEIILECYGRDDSNTLKNLAKKYEVMNNLRINGFTDYKNIPHVLNGKKIFVLSSLYESQNMAVIEASFCGLPVVATDVGVAREISEHLVNPGDFNSLAEKIIYVIENYSDEKQKILSKRESVVAEYSLKKTTKNFIELYEVLLN